MSRTSQFTGHDYTIEIHNHLTVRYDEHPDQNYLLTLWDRTGTFRGNFGGFERLDQVTIAAEVLRRGLVFGTGVRDIIIVETDHYHDLKVSANHE